MPAPLPILAARLRFYDAVKVAEVTGHYQDGIWIPGPETVREIQGSFQSPSYLSADIALSGDAGTGGRHLFTREYLPYYDLKSPAQTFVLAEGMRWRITDRQSWGPISQGLFVYGLERYHKTKTPEGIPEDPGNE
ncbi:MAG: hypothetical protein LBU64_05935 [Planctomycetota bacterium]|jgi:hypothetical protein|nr:hypothetical protein [Planctomycetota bacterium]